MLPLAQVLVFLLLCLELPLASPVGIDFIYLNYCDPKLCPNGGKHVACKATENRLGKKCSLDAEIMPIDGKQQDILVNRINEMRDKVARGGFSGLTAAAKMATMSWDPELAYLAGFNVQECSPHFDECRNTLQYANVGQSVAYRGLLSKHRGMPEILDNAIGLWFREHEVTTMDDILNYIGPHFGKPRENFVQMVVDNCNRVGCAVVQQSKNGWLQTYLTCNYAFAPQLGQPIYNSSKVPGAECQSGHNPTFKNLCSVSEVYVRNVIPPPVDAQQLMRLLPGGEPPAAEETEPDSESSSYDESEMEPFHPGPHDFEPLKQPKYKRRPKGQKQWGLNLNPWGGIDKSTTTPKEVTTASAGGITTAAAAAAGGEKITLAAGGKETTAAAGKETTVGAGGAHTTVAAGGKETTVAAGKETTAAPGGKETTAAPGGKEITAAAGGVSTESPGGITTAAAGGEMITAAAGGQETTVAAGGEQTTVAEGGAETTAAAGGRETTAVAAGGETEAPAARRRSVKRRSPPLRQRTKVQPKKVKARTNKGHKSEPKTRTAKRRRSKIQRRFGDGETTVAAEGATPVGEAGAADGGATTAAGGEANTEGGGTTAAEGEANTEGGGTTTAGGEVGGVTTAAGEPTSAAGATTVSGGEPTAVEGATAEGEGATTVAGETNAAGGELTTVAGAATVGATIVGGIELTTLAGDTPVAGATTVAGAATVAGGGTTLGGGQLITVAGAITPGVGGLSTVLGVTTVGGGVATVGGAQGATTPLPGQVQANVQQQIPPLPGGQPPPENEKKPTAVTEKDNIDDSYALEEMEDEVKAEEKMEKEKANDGQAIEDRAAIQRKFARFLAMVRKAKVLNKRGKVMIVTTNHEVEYNSRKVQERSARRRAARRLQKRTRAVDRARRMRRSRSRRHRGKRAMRRSYQNQPRKNQPRSRRLRRQHAKTRAKGDARWNVVG